MYPYRTFPLTPPPAALLRRRLPARPCAARSARWLYRRIRSTCRSGRESSRPSNLPGTVARLTTSGTPLGSSQRDHASTARGAGRMSGPGRPRGRTSGSPAPCTRPGAEDAREGHGTPALLASAAVACSAASASVSLRQIRPAPGSATRKIFSGGTFRMAAVDDQPLVLAAEIGAASDDLVRGDGVVVRAGSSRRTREALGWPPWSAECSGSVSIQPPQPQDPPVHFWPRWPADDAGPLGVDLGTPRDHRARPGRVQRARRAERRLIERGGSGSGGGRRPAPPGPRSGCRRTGTGIRFHAFSYRA